MDSFDFGWNLVMELVIPNMKVRRGTPGLQKFITEKIDMFLRVNLRNIAAAATPQVEDEDRGEDDDDRIEEIVIVDDGGEQADPAAIPAVNPQAARDRGLDIVSPKTGLKRKCKKCKDSVQTGAGYHARKDKLYKVAGQCQGCQDAACQAHLVQFCGSCYEKRVGFAAPGEFEQELLC